MRLVRALIVLAVAGVLAWAMLRNADDWSDWVVYGVLLVLVFGVAVGVEQRQYPARRRALSRGSDDR